MGKTYLVELDRDACIGAAACVAADEENWELVEDGKADLKGAERVDDNKFHKKEIDESELDKYMEAAQSCPVTVIHITDKETGEKLI
jgi:ferredoxin